MTPRSFAATLLVVLAACPAGDDSDSATSDGASGSSTGGTGDADSSSSGEDESGVPEPGVQGDPCTCEGADPNACSADSSTCGAPLSCIVGGCRRACTDLDDESCPDGTVCIGIEVEGVDLGFWCS